MIICKPRPNYAARQGLEDQIKCLAWVLRWLILQFSSSPIPNIAITSSDDAYSCIISNWSLFTSMLLTPNQGGIRGHNHSPIFLRTVSKKCVFINSQHICILRSTVQIVKRKFCFIYPIQKYVILWYGTSKNSIDRPYWVLGIYLIIRGGHLASPTYVK